MKSYIIKTEDKPDNQLWFKPITLYELAKKVYWNAYGVSGQYIRYFKDETFLRYFDEGDPYFLPRDCKNVDDYENKYRIIEKALRLKYNDNSFICLECSENEEAEVETPYGSFSEETIGRNFELKNKGILLLTLCER